MFLNTKSKFTIQLFEIEREMGKSVCVVFLVWGGGGVETYKIKENEPTVFHSREMQGNTVWKNIERVHYKLSVIAFKWNK